MTLKELESLLKSGGVAVIEVHAVDPVIYVVFQRFGERLLPVLDGRDTARYRSRYAAFKALAERGVCEVDFVHRSAYGEMIGFDSPHNQTELRQRVQIGHLQS